MNYTDNPETVWAYTHWIPNKSLHTTIFPLRIWEWTREEDAFIKQIIRVIIHETIHRFIFRQGISNFNFDNEWPLEAMGLTL